MDEESGDYDPATPQSPQSNYGEMGAGEEEKDISLTEYDRNRGRCSPCDLTEIHMNTRILSTELTCPICLDLLTNTMTTKECLHRFCADCITTALLRGNKECPTCRKKLVSKRSLRPDPNFDELIRKIWPDRHRYEQMLMNAENEPDVFIPPVQQKPANVAPPPVSSSILTFDSNAPTPPALLDSRRSTSPMEDDKDELDGRTTPTWFPFGGMNEEDLDDYEKKLLQEAREAYSLLKSKRALTRDSSADSLEDDDTSSNGSKSKEESTSRDSSNTPSSETNDEDSPEQNQASAEGKSEGNGGGEAEVKMEVCENEENKEKSNGNGGKNEVGMGVDGHSLPQATMDFNSEMPATSTEKPLEAAEGSAKAVETTMDEEDVKKIKNLSMENGELKEVKENGEEMEVISQDGTIEASSCSSQSASDDSSEDSSESEEDDEEQEFDGEVDEDDIDELDMLDPDLVVISTTPPDSPIASSVLPGPSTETQPRFDPRFNPTAPFPDNNEVFHELLPNGKGATWNMSTEAALTDAMQDDDDEEVVYDEDDIISAVDIDDILRELEADMMLEPAEEEKGANDELPEQESEDDEEKMGEEKTKEEEYICDDTRQDLNDLNALRMGGLNELKSALDDGETFEMAENVQWYTQLKDGEEIIYYEKTKMPISRGKRTLDRLYDEDEEMDRIKRRVTFTHVLQDMSDTESEDDEDTLTSSLKSSAPSSPMSLSDQEEEEEEKPSEEAVVDDKESVAPTCPSASSSDIRPPHAVCHVKERLHRWVADIPNHPLTPDDDNMERKFTADEEMTEDGEGLPDNYEIEAELRPAATLLARGVPPEVTQLRFIRSHHNTSMEHLAEYLNQRWLEEVQSRTGTNQEALVIPRPEFFYVFNRQERHCKFILPQESLIIAQAVTSRDDHVVLYYDTERATLSSKEKSFLEKIVPAKDMVDLSGPPSSRASSGSSPSQ